VQHAPEQPGVLQVRAEDLLDYPTGRSAMLFYDHTAPDVSLRAHLTGPGAAALRKAEAVGARWIRFAETVEPKLECQRLLANFIERFGSAPLRNSGSTVRLDR
jgi:hypothetical protein